MIINCDMGEGIGNEEALMPYIDVANIACGYHAGDEETMRRTIALCIEHNVAVGAHPSYYDRENFGRTEMNLPVADIYALIREQLHILQHIATSFGIKLQHIKPHGALYNMSANDPEIAKAIATAAWDHDSELLLIGLSGSLSIEEAARLGLKTASEVFADRSYQDDGRLTPRKDAGAIIDDTASLRKQVEHFKEGYVLSVSGKKIPVKAETICLHGDGKNVLEFARQVRDLVPRQ